MQKPFEFRAHVQKKCISSRVALKCSYIRSSRSRSSSSSSSISRSVEIIKSPRHQNVFLDAQCRAMSSEFNYLRRRRWRLRPPPMIGAAATTRSLHGYSCHHSSQIASLSHPCVIYRIKLSFVSESAALCRRAPPVVSRRVWILIIYFVTTLLTTVIVLSRDTKRYHYRITDFPSIPDSFISSPLSFFHFVFTPIRLRHPFHANPSYPS